MNADSYISIFLSQVLYHLLLPLLFYLILGLSLYLFVANTQVARLSIFQSPLHVLVVSNILF